MFRNFDFCAEVESYSHHDPISSDFREKQRDLRSLHFRLLGRSGLQYSENRPQDSRFEYAQARGILPLQDQTCFRIAWRLRTNIKYFRKVLMIIFLDMLKTDSVRHAGEVLKMRIHKIPKVDDWYESTSKQLQWLKSLEIFKEEFYVFRRIKSENSWKWNKFKTVMHRCNACCLPYPVKNTRKTNVLTQHSVNAHTKSLSEKQSLSESSAIHHLY